MKYGQSVRIKNHPRFSGSYGVIIRRLEKNCYIVSINKTTKIPCMSFQLELLASDGTKLVDSNEICEEFGLNFNNEVKPL